MSEMSYRIMRARNYQLYASLQTVQSIAYDITIVMLLQ